MLGRTQHFHAAIFTRNGVADLSFQIKLLLAAHIHLAGQGIGCSTKCILDVTFHHGVGRVHERIALKCFFYRKNRFFLLVFNHGSIHCAFGLIKGFGHHSKNCLAVKIHAAIGENQITGKSRTDINIAGHVINGDHIDHTWGCPHTGQIQFGNQTAVNGAFARYSMQGSGNFRYVVDIDCST